MASVKDRALQDLTRTLNSEKTNASGYTFIKRFMLLFYQSDQVEGMTQGYPDAAPGTAEYTEQSGILSSLRAAWNEFSDTISSLLAASDAMTGSVNALFYEGMLNASNERNKLSTASNTYQNDRAIYENIMMAYTTPLDFSSLVQKFNAYLVSSVSDIRRTFNEDSTKLKNSQKTEVFKKLRLMCNGSIDLVYVMVQTLMECFNNDKDVVYLFLALGAKYYDTEFSTYKWTRLGTIAICLNAIYFDDHGEIFEHGTENHMDICTKAEYYNYLTTNFRTMLRDFLTNNNISLNLNSSQTFPIEPVLYDPEWDPSVEGDSWDELLAMVRSAQEVEW